LVLGTGFGSFSLVKGGKRLPLDITVISPRNHFLFTPLLASTTVGTLEFRSVIESVRLGQTGEFLLAEAESVDMERRVVTCRGALDKHAFEAPFDILVIGVGATTHTFGVPGVVDYALFLKQINDARLIRQRIFECLERASIPGLGDEERNRLLHFVIVGGGPTGVEFAAELHDLAFAELRKAYPRLIDYVRITLLDAGSVLLSSYDATLSEYTKNHFRRQAIDVRFQSHVVAVKADKVVLKGGEEIPYGCLIWATGNGTTDFVKALPFEKDAHGRILIDDFLRVAGYEGVYALGDCSALRVEPIPATAQAAEQQGNYLVKSLAMTLNGRIPPPFRYNNQGMLAYVGGHSGIADLNHFKGRGFAAFLFWRSVYLTKLVSFRNKVQVLLDWARTFIFGREISRM